jgi:NAD(P)-dependent dehydrogenase (short-subunit alcohol dehydrogenase family)
MQLKDLIVVITGGASGLGASTAQYLAKQGAKVAVFDLNQEAVAAVAKEINGLGVVCDVTSEESVQSALQQTKEKFGVARVCINFAGILDGGRVVSRTGPMELEHFRHVVNVDLIGTFNVMRLCLADMMQVEPIGEERGLIINIASIAAYEGQIGQVAYSASKAGVAGMTLPVAREMAEFGIRVACIAPGVFETPMMQHASDKVRDGLLATTVFPKRFGKPIEIAQFVEHIIQNPMINGDVLRIDGAMRMPAK